MQAALLVRNKRTKRRTSKQLSQINLNSHQATRTISPFPRYNPLKLPNGKNAWGRKGAERKRAEERRKWPNKNKVGAAVGAAAGSAGGTLERSPDGKYRQTGVVNIVLYVGVGLITLGMILTFVGIGDHGFKSPELRLIGPSLIGCGVLFCLLRLFFCTTPSCCKACRKSKPLDEKSLLSPSRETIAEDTMGGEPPKGQGKRGHDNPALSAHDHDEDHDDDNDDDDRPPTTRRLTSKSTRTVQSMIPNYIEDECEDDEALGLNVEYMDETSTRQRSPHGSLVSGATRPGSAASLMSTASKVPRLPEIHGSRRDSELVLNPATLGTKGD